MNYPQVAFVNKDRKIANMEMPHGTKFRFSGDRWSGDFVVDEKIVKQLNLMFEGQRKTAISHIKPPPIPPPPAKIEIKFEGNQSSQPTPRKGG